ncbi:MAG: helix-turn-helix domain-containing protein [Candidatus Binataceae bacterium]
MVASAQGLTLWAWVALASASGEGDSPLTRRLGVSPNEVAVWRRRYRSQGPAGLRTRPRARRPRRLTSTKERAVISATLRKSKVVTQERAAPGLGRVGLSPATVHRMGLKCGLQLHRVEAFKFSRDSEFDAKLGHRVLVSGLAGAPLRAGCRRKVAERCFEP